jgi:hypothetical protein
MNSPNQKLFCLQDFLPDSLIEDMDLLDITDTSDLYESSTPKNSTSQQLSRRDIKYQVMQGLKSPKGVQNSFFGVYQPFFHQNQGFNSIMPQSENLGNCISYGSHKLYDQENIININNNIIELEDVAGMKNQGKSKRTAEFKLCKFLQSQKGSRIFQRRLKKMEVKEIDELLDTLKGHFRELLTNVYGNYFCQTLYTKATLQQRLIILDSVSLIFVMLAQKST